MAHPAVEQVCSKGAEIFLVRGFLKRRGGMDLVEAINRKAEPSPLYRSTELPPTAPATPTTLPMTIRCRKAASSILPICSGST
ncbi:MAG: hypothetical protein ACK4RT_07050 [Erythrobacter sp.]